MLTLANKAAKVIINFLVIFIKCAYGVNQFARTARANNLGNRTRSVECLPFKEKVIGSNPIVFSVVLLILKIFSVCPEADSAADSAAESASGLGCFNWKST